MTFAILSPQGTDAATWASLVEVLPPALRDIHFMPDYAAAQALLGVEPKLAVYQYDDYVVMQPFALRPIAIGDMTGVDIASLYGYGGPVSNHSEPLYAWFNEAFTEWCRQRRVVSEFCALHPLMHAHQRKLTSRIVESVQRKSVVVMNLGQKSFESYKDRREAGIKAARKAGITVDRATQQLDDGIFIRLYRETMLRKHACERWYFPDEYLAALCRIGTVFYALIDGEVESAALMLHAHGTAYYHLAANAMRHPKAGANDLLVHEMAQWARDAGMTRFHLGGGVTAAHDDPVLHFKAGFTDARAPAYSYFRVLDDKAYRDLCLAKVGQEVADTGAEFTSGFLPLYRREAS